MEQNDGKKRILIVLFSSIHSLCTVRNSTVEVQNNFIVFIMFETGIEKYFENIHGRFLQPDSMSIRPLEYMSRYITYCQQGIQTLVLALYFELQGISPIYIA